MLRSFRPFFGLVGVIAVIVTSACSCGGDSNATPFVAPSGGEGGAHAGSPNQLTAKIIATPSAIPKNDNFASTVTLDGSTSTGTGAALAYQWDIGKGKLVTGTLTSPKIAASFDGKNNAPVTLTIKDGSISNAAAIVIRLQSPPVAVVPQEYATDAGAPLTMDGSLSFDRDGDPMTFTWSSTGGPGTANISGAGNGKASFTASLAGDYPVVLTVKAGGMSGQAKTLVHVLPPAASQFPYAVAVTASPAVAAVGAPVTFKISLTEPVTPNMKVTLRAGGVTIPVSNLAGSMTFPKIGDYPVIADVTSPGRGGRARTSLQVFDPSVADDGGPQVSLTSPTPGTRLSQTVTAMGSVTSSQLAAYYIESRLSELSDPERWTQLYTGTSPVSNGQLGPIPYELLRQGTHAIRVRAVDTRGHEAIATTKVILDGGSPRGPVRFVLTDYYAGWSGPVVQIRRAYDSFDHVVRDFGYGWTMDSSGSGSVTQANPVGAGWTPPDAQSCIFGGGQGNELQDHTITVMAGSQNSLYTPQLVQSECITGARIMNLKFVQTGGSSSASLTMDGDGQDFYLTESGSDDPDDPSNMLYFFDASDEPSTPYSPKGWTITTADNSMMKYQDNTLVQTRDAYGNGTDISPDKIVHTSGSTISIERNADKLVTGIVRPDSKRRTYDYNSAKELIAASDFDGRRWRYFYGPDHVLSTIVGPKGDVKSATEYDDLGRVTSASTGSDATPDKVSYDNTNRAETTVHGSDKSVDVSTYDLKGQTTARDINGTPVERYVSDSTNTTGSVIDANGITTMKSDATVGMTSINPQGAGQMDLIRDPKGWVNQINTPAGTIAYERDANGQMTHAAGGATDVKLTRDNTGKVATLNVNGSTTNYIRNAAGHLTAVESMGTHYDYDVNENGDVSGVHYTQNGEKVDVTMTIDADAIPTQATTMVNGTMVSQTTAKQDAEGLFSTSSTGQQVVLDSNGHPLHIIEGTGADTSITSREYDAAGHIIANTSGEGARQTFSVDPMTGAQVTTSATGTQKQTFRDAKGNVLKEINPGGLVTTYEYSATGKKTATHFPDGRSETWSFDEKDRMSKHGFADGTSESFTYDDSGNIATKTQGSNPPWKYTYTGAQVTKAVSPTGLTVDTMYDANSLLQSIQFEGGPPAALFTYDGKTLSSITDPAGHIRKFATSRLGTVLTQTWPSGSTQTMETRPDSSRLLTNFDGHTTTVTFDAKGRVTSQKADDGTMMTAVPDRDGHLTSYTDATGSTSFARDVVGRPLTMTRGDGRYIQMEYDDAFGFASLTTPGGHNAYTYDTKGRVTAVSIDATSSIDVSYDAGGHKSGLKVGGLTVTSAYSDLARVKNLSVDYNGKALLNDTVTYDFDGRPVSLAPMAGTGTARTFAYDSAERITKDSDIAYRYDNGGNIVGIGSRSLTFDVDDHPVGDGHETYTSDKSGHLLSIQGGRNIKLTWDGLGRMVKAVETDGKGVHTITYGYDAQGLLVSRTTDDDKRAFLWTADDATPLILEEYDPTSGDLRARNTYMDRLVVRTVGAHRYTFVTDAFQNARIVIDENGSIVDTRDFTAYGVPRTGTMDLDKPFGFGGGWTDPVTGFVFMRARWYMPDLGRFMSEDTADSIPQAPTTINRFQYGNDEPTVFFDPSGKQLADVCAAMAGYGSLSSTYNYRVITTGFSLLSQLTALMMATVAIDKSGIFTFVQKNNRWFPTSVLLGINVNIGALGVGSDAGIEGLLHVGTNNMNGTMTPYVYGGGTPVLYVPGKGWVNPSADIAARAGTPDGSNDVLPPAAIFSGGYVGGQTFINAGAALYGGFAWDVITPGAYEGAFESFSAPAALFVPIVSLYAMLQLDGGQQMAAAGVGGAGVGGALGGLGGVGTSFLGMMGAFFNAAAVANANPGQIVNGGPPSSNLLGSQAGNFWSSLSDWANAASYSIAFSPKESKTNLCQRDSMGNWLDDTCKYAQAWSLTRNMATAGSTGWSGLAGPSTAWKFLGDANSAPIFFQYKFDMYYCAFGGAPGVPCDEKMDIGHNYGPLPPNPLASVKGPVGSCSATVSSGSCQITAPCSGGSASFASGPNDPSPCQCVCQ